LQVFFRDRGAIVYLLVLPVVFVFMWAGLGAAAGVESLTGDERVAVPVVNLDAGGALSEAFIEALNNTGGVEAVRYEAAEAEALLQDAEINWILTIPAGFTEAFRAYRPVTIVLDTHPDAGQTESETVWRAITGVAQDASLEAYVLAGLQQMGEMQAGNPEAAEAFAPDVLVAQAKSQFKQSGERPLITVEQIKPARVRAEEALRGDITMSEVAVPGFAVLFVFLAAQTTARSIYDEKRHGTFRRLLAAPISRVELLIGKLLPNLVTTLIQIVVIFAIGTFVMPLLGWGKLDVTRAPLGLVLVSLLIALCSTSLGILIAALASTEGQISGVSSAILWIAGIVGGAMTPSFFMPEFLQTVGKVFPHSWAIRAYEGLLIRAQTLSDITPSLIALAVFTALFLAIGLWRFDFD
jgi:ABC-2 type transport system permease protein